MYAADLLLDGIGGRVRRIRVVYIEPELAERHLRRAFFL